MKKILKIASAVAILSIASIAAAQTVTVEPSNPGVSIDPLVRNVPQGQLVQSITIKERSPNEICSGGRVCLQYGYASELPDVTIKAAKVTAKSASSLTVSVFSFSYTVKPQSDTQYMRRAGGTSNLDEFSVGDIVNIQGNLGTDGTITASAIRNVSVQAQNVLHGIVKSVSTSSNSFVLTGAGNGDYTVLVSSATRIIKSGSSCEPMTAGVSQSDTGTGYLMNPQIYKMPPPPPSSCNTSSTVGSLSDIAINATVTVRGSLSGTTMKALEIVINPPLSGTMKRKVEDTREKQGMGRPSVEVGYPSSTATSSTLVPQRTQDMRKIEELQRQLNEMQQRMQQRGMQSQPGVVPQGMFPVSGSQQNLSF